MPVIKSKSTLVSAAIITPVLASTLILVGCAKDAEKSAPSESAPSELAPDKSAPSESAPSEAKTGDVIPSPTEEAPRAAIGDSAPEFKLVDQRGEVVGLSEIRSDSNVAVVFYRSAVW